MALAASTTTLIQAVNIVLQAIGERRVTSLSSPIAALTAKVIQDACYELSTIHDWSFARDKITASAWNLQTATLTDVVRVHGVSAGDRAVGFTEAQFLHKNVFDRQALTGYDSVSYPYGYPTVWTTDSFTEIMVNPYPTDATAQARVVFDVTRVLTPPNVALGVFLIPEFYMPLIYFRAEAVMALQHLADTESMAQFMNLWERFAQRVRERDGQMNAHSLTMHRRGRGYN